VAHDPSVLAYVSLLIENDLMDQARGFGIGCRYPWHGDAGQLALEAFQERHEVKHADHMVLDEDAQCCGCADSPVEFVSRQPSTNLRDRGGRAI
jgi:hypothetical protein